MATQSVIFDDAIYDAVLYYSFLGTGGASQVKRRAVGTYHKPRTDLPERHLPSSGPFITHFEREIIHDA